MKIINVIDFIKNKKKIIRRVAILIALAIFSYQEYTGGAIYEAYITGTGRPLAMQEEIERDEILNPILFIFICIAYATYTIHLRWLILIVVIYCLYSDHATVYFTLLLVVEIIERFIYRPICKAKLDNLDK